MNKKIIIVGSNSNLGKQIIETFDDSSYILKKISRKHFNYIYENEKLFNIIKKFKPKIIINCAALVKIDDCEKKPGEAYNINSFFPFRLGIISQNVGFNCINNHTLNDT